MSLVCCMVPDETCTCERIKSCGGVHIMSADCPQHFGPNPQFGARIHEVGQKPIENVRNSKT